MASEGRFILYALLMGIYITFLYDILHILRKVVPHNGFWISLEDLVFWIYCAIEVFLLMYYESNGTLRWFAILSALTGMFVYKKLVSPVLVKYVSLFLEKGIAIIKKLFGYFFSPISHLCRKSGQLAGKICRACSRNRKNLTWRCKKKLTLLKKLLKIRV